MQPFYIILRIRYQQEIVHFKQINVCTTNVKIKSSNVFLRIWSCFRVFNKRSIFWTSMSVLLDPTTAMLMLSVLISRDHTSVLVTLDILEMDVIVWVNVFQTNVVPFLFGILNTEGKIIAKYRVYGLRCE